LVPEDRARIASALAAAVATNTPFHEEFRLVLPEGTERYLEARGRTFADREGAVGYVTGACIDTTQRRLASDALRESEERYRRALEIETVGVIYFTTEGGITGANDAFLRMSGYTREDLAAQRIRWDAL